MTDFIQRQLAPGLLPTRRQTLALGAASVAAAFLPAASARAAPVASHGLSTFGDLKYPPDFKHFDYVNPVAPKGGIFSQQVVQTAYNQNFNTFDTLHIYVLRGNGAAGIENCFASLMVRGLDEPDALYGLAADSVTASDDRLTYRFKLRPGLTFHDGSPLTAEDAAWSFNILKAKGHPLLAEDLRSFIEAVAEAPDRVGVTLAKERGRDLPLVIAGLPIFSKAWWSSRDFEKSSLEPPLGSGPYKVGRFEVGNFIEIERVKDWWGANLPACVGTGNFDILRWDYFRDRDVAFEAFKARAFLFREENVSRLWALGYDFPAVKDGRIKRETLPDHTPSGAQGWFLNTRRPQFADPRVRQAIGMAFDFEWTNKNIMYGLYDRTASFFQNSDLMATGLPTPAELALLSPFRDKLPPAVFGPAILPPVSDGSGQDRALLHKAVALLADAGWHIEGSALRNAAGDGLAIEFLDDDTLLSPHTLPFIKNLQRLGISASFRVVDSAQLQSRLNDFDFDVTVRRYQLGATPGEDARAIWSSKSAAAKGSNNLSGIADPVIDALVDRIVAAQSRAELTDTCRALDRVLRAGFYWVPQWYTAEHRLAYWDIFAHPAEGPRYDRGAPDTWWAKG